MKEKRLKGSAGGGGRDVFSKKKGGGKKCVRAWRNNRAQQQNDETRGKGKLSSPAKESGEEEEMEVTPGWLGRRTTHS